MLWYVESLAFKRIDAWGLSLILSALALVFHKALSVQAGLLMLAVMVMYWWGYWLNDYYDAAYDSHDQTKARLNFFVQRSVSSLQLLIITLLVIGGTIPIFVSFGWRGWVVLLIHCLVMWAYSAPPPRLKSRPGFDLLAHALFMQPWAYWICLWLTGATWMALDYVVLTLLFLTSLSGQLNQQVRDFDVDSRTDTNFTTRFGLVNTFRLLKISSSAAVLLCVSAVALGVIPWSLLPFCLLALPKLAHHFLYSRKNPDRIFPQWMIYASMMLALAYIGVLVVANWPL
jgi:4-hydroxybenzoate polyprenyltransferase